jgi:hypothetical protein
MSEPFLGENLIFIISQPRSGSTLLQRVLGGSEEISISSEPWIMLHPVYGLRDQGIETEYSADWAARGVTEFLEHYTDGVEVYDDAIRAFAQTIYTNALQKNGGRLFVDKTPRYVMIIDDLVRLFPAAKFIFILRNPLSVLASVVNTQIAHDLSTLERFREELLDGPGNMLRAIDTLGENAVVLRYEEFVGAPEDVTRKLCERLGIDYREAMVEYSDREPVKGFMQDRTGIQQHDRPTDARIDSWRQMLTDPTQIHFAQSYLRALGAETFARLGYDYDELNDAVRAAAERKRGPIMLRWEIAMLKPGEPLGLDQLAIRHYRNLRDYGPLKARIRTIKAFFKALWVQLNWIFGRGGREAENRRWQEQRDFHWDKEQR